MKILDINNLYSPSGGGIHIYHEAKMKWCQANGVENLLLYPSSHNTLETLHGGTVQGIKSPALGNSGYNFFINPKPLRKVIEQFKPDIIELGSGIVVPGMLRKQTLNIPTYAYFHSNWPETLPLSVLGITAGPFVSLFKRFTTPLMYRAYSRLTGVLGASDYSLTTLRKAGLSKLEKIPLGTEPDLFHPHQRSDELRKSFGIQNNTKMILYMGRFAPEKGIHVLMRACTHLFREENLVLVAAGSGHWSKKMKVLASMNPAKLKLPGRITSRNEAAQLMASADAFIAAGPTETFSLATLEALCCGTPVAAYKHAAAAELITGAGGTSIYSPWNSGKALSGAVVNASFTSVTDRDNYRNFAAEFTWDACFNKLFNLYRIHT